MGSEERPSLSGVPLTPYDFFGYLLPGGAFLGAVAFFEFVDLAHDSTAGATLEDPATLDIYPCVID